MEVYIDDMVVKSENTENHNRDLKEVLDIVKKFNMNLNPAKCNFVVSSGKFLGHIVTRKWIQTSTEPIKAIFDLKSPTTLKE